MTGPTSSVRLSSAPVAVVGTGIMGGDIALAFALGGIQTRLWGRREEAIELAVERLRRRLDWLDARGLVTEARSQIEGRVQPVVRLNDAVDGARFVIEATSEDLATKRDVLGRVESVVDPQAVLASTTSSISPTEIAQGLRVPERFVVTHFAQPAHLIDVVEVVLGRATSSGVASTTEDLLRDAGKLPIRVGDVAGFLFARLQYALLRELIDLVDRKIVDADACDLLVRRGYAARLPAMGPFQHADVIGLDFAERLANMIWPSLSDRRSTDGTSLRQHVSRGELGAKSGHGYYDWNDVGLARILEARDDAVVRARATAVAERGEMRMTT